MAAPATEKKDIALNLGPHPVGFRCVHLYDTSRAFRIKKDYRGRVADTELARPVQISIWYPAQPADGARLTIADYVHLSATETDFSDLTGESRQESESAFRAQLDGLFPLPLTDEQFHRILSRQTGAVMDAPPLDGPFPVIVGGGEAHAFTNCTACEFLASHGYVVGLPAHLGVYGPGPDTSLLQVEATARDYEFTAAYLRDLPNVDHTRLGIVASRFVALAAYTVAQRNMNVDALVSLEGWDAYDAGAVRFRQSLYYDVASLRTPVLYLAGDQFEEHRDLTVFDSFRYADRCLVRVREFGHTALLSFHSDVRPDVPEEQRQKVDLAYLYVLHFLNAHLRAAPSGLAFLKARPDQHASVGGSFTVCFKVGLPPPPSAAELGTMMSSEAGLDEALQAFAEATGREPGRPPFQEGLANTFGYALLRAGRVEDAVRVLEWNVGAYPESANTYDSLAEAYMTQGDNELAIRFYQKALELNPDNPGAREALRELGG